MRSNSRNFRTSGDLEHPVFIRLSSLLFSCFQSRWQEVVNPDRDPLARKIADSLPGFFFRIAATEKAMNCWVLRDGIASPASRDPNDSQYYWIPKWEVRIATPFCVGLAMTYCAIGFLEGSLTEPDKADGHCEERSDEAISRSWLTFN